MYQTSVENSREKKSFSWVPWAAVLVVAVGAAALFFSLKKGLDESIAHKEEAVAVVSEKINEENLLGTYDIQVLSGEIENHFTGSIDQDELGVYQLHIYSEYEPRVLRLELHEDGTVSNDELGIGVMTVRKSTDAVKVTFEKGGVKCVLSR